MSRNFEVTSELANKLFINQLQSWPLLRENHLALEKMQLKRVRIKNNYIKVQLNPARTVSSAAKLDAEYISKRKCFLCWKNLPPEQTSLAFGREYLLLCNPYPIFPQHFTIPDQYHTEQMIRFHKEDMLKIARCMDKYTIFYNGPKCGASAPDHMHFQAVTRGYMPIDKIATIPESKPLIGDKYSGVYRLTDYFLNGFLVTSDSLNPAFAYLCDVISALSTSAMEEPMMNIFCNYLNGRWFIKVIPRKKHRPSQFFAEGEEQILTSPGAADIGGVFVTSREEDFHKINSKILKDIYKQISYSDEEIASISFS